MQRTQSPPSTLERLSSRLYDGRVLAWALLILACVASRLATTITYVEDPDSLRFALSVADGFDLASMQPHFPGYPVFWAVVTPLYLILGSFSSAFALTGGLATAGLAGAVLFLWQRPLTSVDGVAGAAVVVFNPLFWLMANRYMPDLLGTTCALAAFAALLVAARRPRVDERRALVGVVLAGLLAGLRLSYLPLVAPPVLWVLWKSDHPVRLVLAGIASVLVWLVPMTLDTGWATLVDVAWAQTSGHFTEFGGTVQTESDVGRRTGGFVRGLWADALGGWWPGRHPLTIAVGLGAVGLGGIGARRLAREVDWTNPALWVGIGGVLTYAAWVFFFQNVIHKSRHVLPLVPFLLLPVAAGAARLWTRSRMGKGIALTALGAYASVALVLAYQHQSPSAIAQAKAFVQTQVTQTQVTQAQVDGPVRIASAPLVNTYLRAQQVDAKYFSVEDPSDVETLRAAQTGKTLVIGTYGPLLNRPATRVERFYHNPYVNRMWPTVTVFVYDY